MRRPRLQAASRGNARRASSARGPARRSAQAVRVHAAPSALRAGTGSRSPTFALLTRRAPRNRRARAARSSGAHRSRLGRHRRLGAQPRRRQPDALFVAARVAGDLGCRGGRSRPSRGRSAAPHAHAPAAPAPGRSSRRSAGNRRVALCFERGPVQSKRLGGSGRSACRSSASRSSTRKRPLACIRRLRLGRASRRSARRARPARRSAAPAKSRSSDSALPPRPTPSRAASPAYTRSRGSRSGRASAQSAGSSRPRRSRALRQPRAGCHRRTRGTPPSHSNERACPSRNDSSVMSQLEVRRLRARVRQRPNQRVDTPLLAGDLRSRRHLHPIELQHLPRAVASPLRRPLRRRAQPLQARLHQPSPSPHSRSHSAGSQSSAAP